MSVTAHDVTRGRPGQGSWFQRLFGSAKEKQKKPAFDHLSVRGELELYDRPESFASLLHFGHYDGPTQTFQYPDSDGLLCGVMFEIRPVDAEGRNLQYLIDIRDRVTTMLNHIPENDSNPWVLQIYVQDEPITALTTEVRDYIAANGLSSEFEKTFSDVMERHLETITRKGGLFVDVETGTRWGARYRRVRCMLYRNYPDSDRHAHAIEEDVNHVYDRVVGGLLAAGVHCRRGQGGDMVEWMRPWLSPSPIGFENGYEQLREMPYDRRLDDPDYDDALASHDLIEQVLRQVPRSSNEREGVWHFGDESHCVLTLESLTTAPRIGAMTIEDRKKEKATVLMDRLPEGTIMSMTIVIAPRDEVALRIQGTGKASIGQSALSELTEQDATAALSEMAQGRRAYPTWMAVFLRAPDDRTLEKATLLAVTALSAETLDPIERDSDLTALSSYPLNLPMGYKPNLEKRTLRCRLQWDKHLANLMPIYGAGTGTGNSGLFFLNRNGGPIMVDPLNPEDRKRVAHAVVVGPTGAGKSAMCNYIACWLMAVHKPHLYIIDVMDSYGLLGEYLKDNGFTVNHIKMNPKADVSLPPFSEAPKLLDDYGWSEEVDPVEAKSEERDRDLLAEMEIAARYLITGGNADEERRFHSANRLTIRNAILIAADRTVKDGRDQTMIDDVVWALRELSRGRNLFGKNEPLDPERRPRAGEMADSMEVFCTGASARYFNRPGQAFPECDVTIVDLDSLVTGGDAMPEFYIVYMGLMNRINEDIIRRRRTGRPTVVINDEAHIVTNNPLTCDYLVNASKMWRRMGAWLWLATQTVQTDFPDRGKAILSQAEFWFVMSLDDDLPEAETIGELMNLKPDERALLMSARKERGRFVEGVMLSSQPATLFRNIPPSICMSLAQTEQSEVAARERVREANGYCSHLEAARIIADELDEARWGGRA